MSQTENGLLERLFKLREKGTSVRTEFVAGITTFLAMAYILFVNPNILAAAGIPKEAAFAATVWSAILATSIMGLWANFPVAVAPGMGLNAFFAYYVCGVLGLHWTTALGAVFISGIVFLILTLTNIRQMIIKAVPMNLKSSIVVGIGMFIAFIGLQGSGIVIKNEATLVTLGHMLSPAPLLTSFGLLLTAGLMARNVRGNILIGIIATTALGMLVGATPAPTSFGSLVSLQIPSLDDTFMKLDIMGAIQYGVFSVILTFTIVELFDNMGTLIGLSRKAGLMDDKGDIQNLDKALITDSVGTLMSACMGTSSVTSYVESAAGVAEGGRTGLTAMTVAALFAASLVLAPLVGLVPAFATAPALILVGSLMMAEIMHVDFTDFTEGFPAFMTIVMMPLTYSIASGFGFVSYALVKLLAGRGKEVTPIMWVITACFIVNFVVRG